MELGHGFFPLEFELWPRLWKCPFIWYILHGIFQLRNSYRFLLKFSLKPRKYHLSKKTHSWPRILSHTVIVRYVEKMRVGFYDHSHPILNHHQTMTIITVCWTPSKHWLHPPMVVGHFLSASFSSLVATISNGFLSQTWSLNDGHFLTIIIIFNKSFVGMSWFIFNGRTKKPTLTTMDYTMLLRNRVCPSPVMTTSIAATGGHVPSVKTRLYLSVYSVRIQVVIISLEYWVVPTMVAPQV